MERATKQETEEFSKSRGEPEFMLATRLSALEKLSELKSAVFRYGLNISTDFSVDESSLKLFSRSDFEIKTTGPATAVNLDHGLKDHPELFRKHYGKSYRINNRMLAMNAAFLNGGVLIHLPRDSESLIRLKLKGGDANFSHVLVIAEEGSEATIVEEISGKGSYRSGVVEIAAGANSLVRYAAVQKLGNCRQFTFKKASLSTNANVEWLDLTAGGSVVKSEVVSDLIGDGSCCNAYSGFFGNGEQQYDFSTRVDHVGKNTNSTITNSGALKDKSRAIQQSFARICDTAHGAAAHQKAKALLLNEGTKAIPIPKLEIENNDVTATHEASVSRIDDEKTFYMMSRGIDEKTARKTFVRGFLEPFAQKISIEELKQDVEKIVSERMES